MNREIVDKFMEEFPLYADQRLRNLPDGWTALVRQLFVDLYDLQKLSPQFRESGIPVAIVDIEWRFYVLDTYTLFVRPLSHIGGWTPEMAMSLMRITWHFNETSRESCEVCGRPMVGILKFDLGRQSQRLCQQHMDERRWS